MQNSDFMSDHAEDDDDYDAHSGNDNTKENNNNDKTNHNIFFVEVLFFSFKKFDFF